MKYELISVITIIMLFLIFNTTQQIVSIPLPVEKMSNISIFDNE